MTKPSYSLSQKRKNEIKNDIHRIAARLITQREQPRYGRNDEYGDSLYRGYLRSEYHLPWREFIAQTLEDTNPPEGMKEKYEDLIYILYDSL
jgi:hypothetical protein